MDANRQLRATRIQQQVTVERMLAHLGKRPPSGTAQIYCPNPDHPEKHPSARLYEATNSVHCFKCGRTWDVVGIAALVRRLDRGEAIEWVERAFNLPPIGQQAAEMVAAVVKGAAPTSDLTVVMQRLRLAKRTMPKARYLRAWVLFDQWRDGHLDIESAQQVRDTLDQWTRDALGATA